VPIWSVDSQKMNTDVIFKSFNAPNSISAKAPSQSPKPHWGKLQHSTRHINWIFMVLRLR